jgi:hypothetical protein
MAPPGEVAGEAPLEVPLMASEEEDGDHAEDGQEPPHAGEALSEGQLRVTVVDAHGRVDRQAEQELRLRK